MIQNLKRPGVPPTAKEGTFQNDGVMAPMMRCSIIAVHHTLCAVVFVFCSAEVLSGLVTTDKCTPTQERLNIVTLAGHCWQLADAAEC